MRLPAPLSRRNPFSYKNSFGHVLVLAGSKRMLGAGSLTALAAMRSGSGLVTLAVPKSLNGVVQKKISPIIMTWPLPQTLDQCLSLKAYPEIKKNFSRFQALTIGPGLSQNPSTQKLVQKIISSFSIPMVIDADALTAIAGKLNLLKKNTALKILTPHIGEMQRLTGLSKKKILKDRKKIAKVFAQKYHCTLLLKGHQTIVASEDGKIYVNHTGNVGMATAGSGDVLAGIIAAFLAQGLSSFEAARWGALIHGKAGDLSAEKKGKISLIATDILENIPDAFR